MLGALAVLGSSSPLMDSHSCPCLCVDALPGTGMNLKSSVGDMVPCKNPMAKNHLVRRGAMGLSSSFIDSGREWRLCVNRSSKKQRKGRRVTIVNELGGQYEDTFDDVKVVTKF